MEAPLQNLSLFLENAERAYGCFIDLIQPQIIQKLSNIPCTIILHETNWTTEPYSTACQLYAELKPVTFDYFQKLNRNLAKRKEDYSSKAIRVISINVKSYHKFLIIESKQKIGLWIGSFEQGLYTEEMTVIEDFRNEFLRLLCLSFEIKDKSREPFSYYYFLENELDSWQVLEEKDSKGQEEYSALTQVNSYFSSPSVRLAGKVLYTGLVLALETKYPHLSIVKRILEKWI